MEKISFGTSGWRGLVAEDFTFANVRAVTQAIAEHLRSEGSAAPVIVAYDTRFLAEEFARAVSEVLAGNGLKVILSQTPYPTPAVAWEILHRKAAGAINITASHNPHPWNGLKFSPASAGPALPEMTSAIETRANAIVAAGTGIIIGNTDQFQKNVVEERLGSAYFTQIRSLVDFNLIARARPRLVVDPLYGTSSGLLDVLLRDAGLDPITQHTERDPYFGGQRPEPEGHSLSALIDRVRTEKAALGLATDCDADRFGIVDSDGTFFSANHILALLVGYLAETRGWTGAVGRSVATTHLFDAAAKAAGLEVIETPVGFKFLGELLIQNRIRMAGEESGGFSVAGHVPDKDGILTCLLVTEMVARRGKTLAVQLEDLFQKVGRYSTTRRDLAWVGGKATLGEKLKSLPSELAGQAIRDTVTVDGTKLILADGSWVLVRASGTEPIIRVYAEAGNDKRVAALVEDFTRAIGVADLPAH